MNRYAMQAYANGKLVATARFEATEEAMKELLVIYNLAHWPVGITVNVIDDVSGGADQPVVVGSES